MTDPPTLDDARRLKAKLDREQARADATRADLHSLIGALLDRNERQVDIATATGYTRERLRQIAAKRQR